MSMRFEAIKYTKAVKLFPNLKEEGYINNHSRSNSYFQKEFCDLGVFTKLIVGAMDDSLVVWSQTNTSNDYYKIFYKDRFGELRQLKFHSACVSYLSNQLEMLYSLTDEIYLCKVFKDSKNIVFKVVI